MQFIAEGLASQEPFFLMFATGVFGVLSLAWVADEWLLLKGDPADLNELERAAGY